MALVKCKKCENEFSTDAWACPNCGKRHTSRTTKIILGIFLLGAIMSFFQSLKESNRRAGLTPEQLTAENAEKTKQRIMEAARDICLSALKSSLNDPDSAKLERTSDWYTEQLKDGTVLVQPTGRAKNLFGAYIHGTWNCVAKPEGKEIKVLSLTQIRP